jgi:hypothetical protein
VAKDPYIYVKGDRIEIDGVDVLVVLTPIEGGTPERVEAITQQLCSASYPVVLATRASDGTYRFSGHPTFSEKLRARNATDLHWTSIPVRLPD